MCSACKPGEESAAVRYVRHSLEGDEAERRSEDADGQFDADFALMTGELSRFLPRLVTALGGEKTSG